MSTQTETQFSRALRRSRDRKSTRLNSSHDQISYAVFCLKKKKKHHLRRSIHKRTPRMLNSPVLLTDVTCPPTPRILLRTSPQVSHLDNIIALMNRASDTP